MKHTIISCLILLISGFGITLYYLNRNLQLDQKINKTVMNSTVEQTIKTYWEASLNGETEIVKQISTFPPKDMFQECVENESLNTINQDGLETTPSNSEPYVWEKEEMKGERPIFSEIMPDNIGIASNFIYTSKISFDRVEIEKNNTYKDEAMVFIGISDYMGNFPNSYKKIIFLKNQENVWKIVGVANTETIDLTSTTRKIKYGTPRPMCSY